MSHTPDVSPRPEPPADPAVKTLTEGVSPVHRRRLLLTLTAITVAVLVLDQLTKIWAEAWLVSGERTPVLGDLLGLGLIHNPGAALSIPTGMTWGLTLVAT
ncbi:MAG: signal peptidase II, partial [Cellulomonas sp.]|nr:signal peptidase II [Cellulomonas sp.]